MVVRRSEVAELAEIERAIAKYGLRIRSYDQFNLPQHPSQSLDSDSEQEALQEPIFQGADELVPFEF